MKLAYLGMILLMGTIWTPSMSAQTRPLSVCEALSSVGDRQHVNIRAAISSTHGTYLYEGTGQEPCPGWRRRFFTAPSAIPLAIGSYSGVHVPEDQVRLTLDFLIHLKARQRENPSARYVVTASGVFVRKRWPLLFRGAGGTYCCWGEGVDGRSAAILVVMSTPIEEH